MRTITLVAMSLVAVSAKNINALQPVQSQSETCKITCPVKGGNEGLNEVVVWKLEVVHPFTCSDCTSEFLLDPKNIPAIVDAVNNGCSGKDCITVADYNMEASQCTEITTTCGANF